ncbi:MAG: carboxypeptidase-like regulatory domain-containing protein [Sarcina sp.]
MNKSVYINGEALELNKFYNIDIVINQCNKTVVNGVILDKNKNPISGAVIEIKELNSSKVFLRNLGMFTTNDAGEYAFLLDIKEDFYYQFTVYPSLN